MAKPKHMFPPLPDLPAVIAVMRDWADGGDDLYEMNPYELLQRLEETQRRLEQLEDFCAGRI